MRQWFVVNSKPQQETRAAIELSNQDFEVFLPILDGKPMFPRYLFTAFDRERDPWGKVQHTRGCSGLLRNGFLPVPVRDDAIMALKSYRPPEPAQKGETQFTKGQAVQIMEGPLAGLQGLFQADEKRRVYALLEICGKPIKVPRQSIRAA